MLKKKMYQLGLSLRAEKKWEESHQAMIQAAENGEHGANFELYMLNIDDSYDILDILDTYDHEGLPRDALMLYYGVNTDLNGYYSQYNGGNMYADILISQLSKNESIMKHPADAGFPFAQMAYGNYLLIEHGWKNQEAHNYLLAAALQGQTHAMISLAQICIQQKKHKQAAKWLVCGRPTTDHIIRIRISCPNVEELFIYGQAEVYSELSLSIYNTCTSWARSAALYWIWARLLPQRDVMLIIARMVYKSRENPADWGYIINE